MAKPKVLIIFFTKRGRLLTLAQAIGKGAADAGADVSVRRIESTDKNDTPDRFAEEVLKIPVVTKEEIFAANAILIGAPGRQGHMCAQVAAFLDTWLDFEAGKLTGKIGGAFTSTGGVGRGYGGHEAILQNFHATFLQNGMLVAGVPPTDKMDAAPHSSPFGACMSGAAGSGARELSEEELFLATSFGAHVSALGAKLA